MYISSILLRCERLIVVCSSYTRLGTFIRSHACDISAQFSAWCVCRISHDSTRDSTLNCEQIRNGCPLILSNSYRFSVWAGAGVSYGNVLLLLCVLCQPCQPGNCIMCVSQCVIFRLFLCYIRTHTQFKPFAHKWYYYFVCTPKHMRLFICCARTTVRGAPMEHMKKGTGERVLVGGKCHNASYQPAAGRSHVPHNQFRLLKLPSHPLSLSIPRN